MKEVARKFVAHDTKIILIIGNGPAHSTIDSLKAVEFVYHQKQRQKHNQWIRASLEFWKHSTGTCSSSVPLQALVKEICWKKFNLLEDMILLTPA